MSPSEQRSIALLSPHLVSEYPKLVGLGTERGWRFCPQLGAVQIQFDDDPTAATDLLDFLAMVIEPSRLDGLRAAWVSSEKPLDAQVYNLIHAHSLRKLLTENDSPLPELLKENRIETWFQPIFRTRSMDLWGYECLVRGRSEEGELIGAGQLLKWGQLDNLTVMLDRICRDAHLQNAGKLLKDSDCRILVNYLPTAANTTDSCLQSTIALVLREGIDPERIIFEVVETERIPNPSELRNVLDDWRQVGFGIALDDVGNGYSSLAVLCELAPDLIKIDRHMIARAVYSAWHRDVCAFLVRLANQNGKLVLAEGVETVAEKRLAETLGVDLLQGFLLGRPSPEPAFSCSESVSSEARTPGFC